MVTGVSGANFSSVVLRMASMKAALTGISPTKNVATWVPWPTLTVTFSNVTDFYACLRPSKVLARIEPPSDARDEAAGFHVVHLHARPCG